MREVKLGKSIIRDYSKPFVIAEVGANFNGDMDMAKKMIVKAKEAGVDAVKFQSWVKESIIVKEFYEEKETDMKSFGHNKLSDLLDYLALSREDHFEIKKFCDEQGILFSSTPISFADVDLLDELDVPFFKIASMDLNHLPFIEYIAKKGRPVILSTGMGTMKEVEAAVQTFLKAGNNDLILLHCVALYPPDDSEVNLNNIDLLREKFDLPIGYSDHTLGIAIPLASVVKGACVIEKHYTLDKSLEGWDHKVSATPDEFAAIVCESARIVQALGTKERVLTEREEKQKSNFRRSIVTKRVLAEGTRLTADDLEFKRPGTGIPPDQLDKIIGKKVKNLLNEDTVIQFTDIQ